MADGRNGGTYAVEPDFAARQALILAVGWLLVAVTVGVLVHIRFFVPDLASGIEFLAWGRLRAMYEMLVVYGWLTTLGFAAVFAILPRLTESQLHNEVLGGASAVFWSALLSIGVAAALVGFSEGRPLAETPPFIALGMLLMAVFVLYNAGVTAVRRRVRTLYVSAWYLLAAALLFPLLFAVGHLPMFTGVTDAIVSGFYASGLELLWLLPIGLAAAHYVVPVETGNPLYSMRIARIGFWTLILAGGWAGQRFFVHGPGPGYLETIAIAMTVVLLIPMVSALVNLIATGRGRWHLLGQTFGLRFALAGLVALGVWVTLVVVGTLPQVSRLVGLTPWHSGLRHLALFGVFTSLAFALIYHVYPLMMGRDWYSRTAAGFHFWVTVGAAAVGSVALLVGGVAQGAVGVTWGALAAGDVGELWHVNVVLQRGFQLTAGLAFLALAVAQYVFAYNAYRTVRSGPVVQVVEPATIEAGSPV